MIHHKPLFALVFALLVTSCAAPRPVLPQAEPTATRTRGERPTPTKPAGETSTPAAVATVAASPTVAPTAAATVTPAPTTANPVKPIGEATTPSPSPAPKAMTSGSAATPTIPPPTLVATGSVLAKAVPSLDPRKYAAPVLLTPDNNAVYHVSQPLVHFVWGNTPSDLLTFGQLPQCASGATNFRKVFESTHLVFHSLDAARPDIEAFMDTGTDFNINLTTVPSGRYSWWVNVAAVCESYVIGKRTTTIERYYLGAVSPSTAPRTLVWIP